MNKDTVSKVMVSFDDRGGMRHYLDSLADGMSRSANVRKGIFTASKAGTVDDESPCLEIAMSEKRMRHLVCEKYNPLYYHRAAQQLLSRCMPSLVHITSYGTGILAFASFLKKKGVKVAYTVHDPLPHAENVTIWARVVGFYTRNYQLPRLFRLIDAIHVHSVKHRDDLLALYGDRICDKIYIVQHGGGVPPSIKGGTRVPPEIAGRNLENDYVILFFGRVHPYKGLSYLSEAFATARKKGCRATLVVAGQGDAHGVFDGNDENIILVNRYIEDEEVAALFGIAHVVVLPYSSATQSGVVPLAYAFGKPVISTDVGALHEIVLDNRTGLLVPPRDGDALADAIIALKDRELRDRMGRAALQFLREHINWESVARKHVDHYENIFRTPLETRL